MNIQQFFRLVKGFIQKFSGFTKDALIFILLITKNIWLPTN